ncbi:MAG: polymer-forming cytoskeletal protein [Acidobacteriota bacterium]
MWEKKEAKGTRQPDPPPTRSRLDTGPASSGASVVNIGPSIFIKGELSGDEDLTIEGKVEGKIELKNHNLTIGPKGKIQANVSANAVTIKGDVQGNVFAREKVEILNSGRLTGDICSPRIVISDGAHFRGSVDMEKKDQGSGSSDRSRQSASTAGAYAHQVAEPVGAARRS